MPAFVITTANKAEAVLCSSNVNGQPDKRSAIPVKATISATHILIGGEAFHRRIISANGCNGITTFLVDGTTKQLQNRERRRGLHKARSLLHDLERILRQLTAEADTKDYQPIRQSLQTLFDWVHKEYDREQSTQ
jgi:hypothetical protein